MITHTFTKKKVFVTQEIEGHPNVITKLEWVFTFTDGVSKSTGAGAVEIKVNDASEYLYADTVTDADLEQYVIDNAIGLEWGNFVAFHEQRVKELSKESSWEVFYSNEAEPTLIFGGGDS